MRRVRAQLATKVVALQVTRVEAQCFQAWASEGWNSVYGWGQIQSGVSFSNTLPFLYLIRLGV